MAPRLRLALRLALALALACSASATAPAGAACATDLDCSLNGVCDASSGACACDAPWTGAACAQLAFATTTPASGKSLYNASDVRNTWNGPIVAAGGLFHLFVPLYPQGSLGTPTSTLHGVAASVTGPYDWASRPQLPLADENPAFVVYVDAATSKTVYSLWLGGMVRVADSVDGPFVPVASYPGGNPAPVFHNNAFFMTNQATLEVYTTPAIVPGAAWTVYGNISHDALPPTSPPGQYHVEDPFLWIDKRGRWHIINHAYSNVEYENCAASAVSAHFFSPDGKNWSFSPQPYGHTVSYDDGTEHTYVTLERPNLHFDASGQMTHLNLAADLVTGAEGCASRPDHAHNGHCPCDNCKWDDHAGTIIVALAV